MAQSHSLLGCLWFELEEEGDGTANILREILGQHTIELLTLDHSSPADVQHALRPVYWIKALFDLQRAYAQATAFPNIPGILPFDLICATVLHLLNVHVRIFPGPRLKPEHSGQRLLITHAILSGFRLLTLLNERLDFQRVQHLQKALQQISSQPENLSGIEQFIFTTLMPSALAVQPNSEVQSGTAYSLNLRQLGLPTFAEGLYPLCLRPGRLIETAFTHIRERGRLWLTWYWTLFDAIWASEAALIQYDVDNGAKSQEVELAVPTRGTSPGDVRLQLRNGRRNLLSAIFNSACSAEFVPDSCILESLKATVVEWWLDSSLDSPSGPSIISEKHALDIRFSLDTFGTWLRDRARHVAPTVTCVKCSPSPFRQVPIAIHGSERSNSIFFHKNPLALPSHENQDTSNDIERLDTPVSSDGVSTTMTTRSASFSSSTTGPPRRPSRPVTPPISSRLTPIASVNSHFSSSTGEESPPVPTSPKVKLGTTIRQVLKSAKERKCLESCRPSNFCFSASGLHLYLWGGNISGFMRISTSPNSSDEIEDGKKWELPAIKCIAAGTERCVVLASHQDKFKLLLFNADKPRPEAQISLDLAFKHYTDCCMVMSRDDKYVALAVNDSVRLYQMTIGQIRRVRLHEQLHLYQHLAKERRLLQSPAPGALSSRDAAREAQSQSAVVEQKLSFSPSGDRLVVATHLADHYVYVDVYKLDGEPCSPISSQPKCFPMPPFTASDGGLTNVFYSDAHQIALICAYIAKEYPNLLYFTGSWRDIVTDEGFGSKIVQAAQASDSSFLVASGLSEMTHLKFNESGTTESRRLKKCASKLPSGVFKPGNLILALPHPQTAIAFWTKDSKLVLRRMDIGQDTEAYTDYELRSLVDRLQSEDCEAIVLSTSVTRPGKDSTVLHRESLLQPPVELPGSLRPISELSPNGGHAVI
ncbi:hypothetical protein, variant [Verruconis gallopava]|uniref:Uncharacterized protein n=1 Tax=Verruconis gallopava TaxID=253628 RepID=A0A0D2AJR7_9PEZI|nr:uncharacterized protein PV09_01984 [Verruconis gallopava]XP_016216977.1 hypothetical protein, variant [Verruconis gallopava]KIW07107.1 hypothetical protein PV09_01984 [Verruconis gallopava]KIW07108.1 hypothetical protein, variant [Verruconis gallopava]